MRALSDAAGPAVDSSYASSPSGAFESSDSAKVDAGFDAAPPDVTGTARPVVCLNNMANVAAMPATAGPDDVTMNVRGPIVSPGPGSDSILAGMGTKAGNAEPTACGGAVRGVPGGVHAAAAMEPITRHARTLLTSPPPVASAPPGARHSPQAVVLALRPTLRLEYTRPR